MLKSHCIVEYYKYDINLIKPIKYICQLTYDILSISTEQPNINSLFEEDFIANANIDLTNLPKDINGKDSIGWLSDQLALFFVKDILNKIDLKKTSILLIHQTSKILYALNKSNRSIDKKEEGNIDKKQSIKNALVRLIKEQKLIKLFAEKISDEKIRNCIKDSSILDVDELYFDCVTVEDTDVPFDVPYFEYYLLDENLINTDFAEASDVWINKDKLKSELKIEIGTDNNVSIIRDSDIKRDIGLRFNNFVFPLKSNLNSYIQTNKKADFYWIQIKDVFKVDDNKKDYKSALISSFKSEIKKKNFTNLLSYLQKNLYISNELLKREEYIPFKKYFTSSLKIQDVKYLKKLNFFINDAESSTSFGIYSSEKLAEDSNHFNLVHWYDRTEEGKDLKYRDNLGPKGTKEVHKVNTLKPEIAFYFITKYFEDFIECLLEDIHIQFINNFHLFKDNEPLGEFDFLVKKSNTFYFIEVKTTLNKYYISDYGIKCKKIIESFKNIDVELEFIIIGAYSNNTIEDLKHYVTTSHKGHKRYNKRIEELDTVPYYFNYPIEASDKKIQCISESNYSSLKTLLKKCLK
ncbi:hypothetical protein [uncultured Chryseobacterium sp.]|uniref:hypothetical protein n=1 Tax=uncultured Chryseobacterium sp. TaxID=259322 RepID=UPI00258720DA|nr:hypothetical protein [uncultured Chryseobacterium sp.]